MEFDAGHLYSNAYSASSSVSTFASLFVVEFEVVLTIISLIVLISHFAPIVANQISSITEGFSHLFFLAAIHVFTSFFIVI